MDRTELINKMHQTQGVRLDVGEGNQTYISKDVAVKLVQDLRVTSSRREKICIPQYVAEYIKKCKENDDISLFLAIRRGCSGSPEYIAIDRRVRKWFMTGGDACVEKFARAWVNGFTVEEPKYNVKIESSFGTVGIYLFKQGDEVLAGDNFKAYRPKEDEFRLTEREIRSFQNGDVLFEHFAVKVEEMEE